MDKQTLINSIKNFLSMQVNPEIFSEDINNIINELSESISEDLSKSLPSIVNDTDSSNTSDNTFNNNSDNDNDSDNNYDNTDTVLSAIPEGFIKASQKISEGNFFKSSENKAENNFSFINKSQYNKDDFINTTPYSGFDSSNPQNARQNNYAWSFADFGGFIYVGTGRNITFAALVSTMSSIHIPIDYTPSKPDMGAEIWRYKKDGSLPWQRVYKSTLNPKTNLPDVIGIRSIIKFNSFGVKPALYASAYSMSGIKILKSTNGVDWFDIPTGITQGTSSRSMMIYKNKIYLAVMSDDKQLPSLLYSSKDPELFGWTLETPQGEEGKNPIGTIWSMTSFNNHIYVGTSSKDGFMVWRTNSDLPKADDWKLVIDKGAGDAANDTPISLIEFKDNLYIGTAYNTFNFMSYILPKGAEIIRLYKDDKWEVVVGGPIMTQTEPETGTRNDPLSKLSNGFSNPYNLYMWQMKVYNNKLFVGTYDTSAVVEPTYELLLKNKETLSKLIDSELLDIIILFAKLQVAILSKIQSQIGFDFYVTEDGTNYKLIDTTGFNNPQNCGIRNIFINDDNDMYIGTANPFSGCEVYKLKRTGCDTNITSGEDFNNKTKTEHCCCCKS